MDIAIASQNGIFSIVLNRPQRKNALTAAMFSDLAQALRQAELDPGVRAILICGQPDAFCAGYDLEDMAAHPPGAADSPVLEFLQVLAGVEKPVVAAVSGIAVGVGVTLLLHCDMVYAAERTRFSLPFAELGLCPEAGASYLLPQLAGYQRASEYLLLGEPFSAEQAREFGLVNRVVPAAQLLAFAIEQAGRLAALPSASVRATKRLLKSASTAQVQSQMHQETEIFRQLLGEPAAQSALKAFLAKRRPENPSS